MTEIFTIPELVRHILLRSDYETAVNICHCCQLTANICKDDNFWRDKVEHDFNISATFLHELPPRIFCMSSYTHDGKNVTIGSEIIIGWIEFAERAIKHNKINEIEYAIKQSMKLGDRKLFAYIIRNAPREALKYYKTTVYDNIIRELSTGYPRQLDFLISLPAPGGRWNWDYIISKAVNAKVYNMEYLIMKKYICL